MTSPTLVSGSNETINEAAGCSINLSGSNDVVNVAGSGYVGLISGNGDTIDMNSGSVDTVNNITGIVINGSNDVVGAGAGDSINVNGSNDVVDMANGGYVGLVGGSGDSVNMSNGGLDTVSYIFNVTLNGSNDTVGAGVDNSINVNGSNDTIQMAGGGYVGLVGGNADTVYLTGGTLATVYYVTNIALYGSYDLISTGAGCSISIYGSNNDADMLTTGYVGNIEGNNNQAYIGNSGYIGNVIGSNNSINIGTGSYIGLVSGNANTLFINNGTVYTLNNVTNIALNGSSDSVATGSGCSIAIDGSTDTVSMGSSGSVGVIAGNDDTVNMSGGTLNMLSGITALFLNGSSNSVGAGASDQINVTGSGNSITAGASTYVGIGSGTGNWINVGSGSYVWLGAGSGNNVNMSGGNLGSNNNITGFSLTGSNDVASLGSGMSLNVIGNGDIVTVGTGSYVGIISANADTINMSGGSTDTAGIVTNITVNGSGDSIATAINNSFNINGSGDVLSMGSGSTAGTVTGNSNTINIAGTGRINNVAGNSNSLAVGASGYVGLVSGDANTVNMSSGTLNTLTNVTNTTLNGSSDTANIASGNQITVNGNSNTLNVAAGSTVTLTASDSGDTINGYGVTVTAAAGVTGITVNGFNNAVSGAGAAAVTQAPDIPLLVSYFEANPYLSQDQIQAVENNPSYSSSLEAYLSSANLYGSPNALPSNVLAMLDGYSSIYLALAGVPASDLSEAAYIEQQVGWAETNYPMPATIQVEGNIEGIGSILQNLMPVLESTNTNTQSLVSDAIGLLEYGNAGAPAGNQTPMLSDTTAEMLLAIAESPGFSAATQSSTEVYTPGRSGHWQIVANGDGTYTQTFKSPPLIETVLSDFDSYVAPIIDIAAVLTLNPAFIAATGLTAAVATGVQVAATAVNLVQAGQDFAAGDDLQGVLGVAAAVGSVLSSIGSAEQQANYAAEEAGGAEILDNTTNVASVLGEGLSYGSAIAQSIDGLAAGNGTFLQALTNALGVVGGVAGLENDTTVQQFAALGAGLASTVQNGENGDVLAALTSLVQSTTAYQNLGGISGIKQDIESMWAGFTAELSGSTPPSLGSLSATDLSNGKNNSNLSQIPEWRYDGQTPVYIDEQGNIILGSNGQPIEYNPEVGGYTPIYSSSGQIVGVSFLDPLESANENLVEGVKNLANAGQLSGFAILVHGVVSAQTGSFEPGTFAADSEDVGSYSAAQLSDTLLLDPNSGYNVLSTAQLFICGGGQTSSVLANSSTQIFANLLGAGVIGATGYISMAQGGQYFINTDPTVTLSALIASEYPVGEIDIPGLNNGTWAPPTFPTWDQQIVAGH